MYLKQIRKFPELNTSDAESAYDLVSKSWDIEFLSIAKEHADRRAWNPAPNTSNDWLEVKDLAEFKVFIISTLFALASFCIIILLIYGCGLLFKLLSF